MKNYGFRPSVIDGTEHSIELPKSLDLPAAYSYEDVLPPVIDQGADPICVPCSASAYLNWRENLVDGEPRDNKINLFEIYSAKRGDGEGMTFKEAFRYLRHHGVSSRKGVLRIGEYVLLRNILEIKYALLANGPCFGALPVYGDGPHFWRKEESANGTLLGYHAISLVGYTEDSLIIRNSWGRGFGDNGYTLIKYGELGKMLEAWSIVG